MTYASLDQLKSALGITTTDDDALLLTALDGASRFIDEQCGRTFTKTTSEMRTFRGTGFSPVLRIDDAVSVSQVATVASGVTTVLESVAYALDPPQPRPGWPYERLRITGGGVPGGWWPALPSVVQVTAVWGWPAVPADITVVCLSVAARFYRSSKLGFADVIQGLAEGRTQVLKSLSTWDRMVLHEYDRKRAVVFA